MSWNGSGVFNRLFSWVADKAAGLDISSTRMDADTNDITSNGFGNCLTRDGQGSATANLPMNGFRHTGVGNAQARTDYVALGQLQDGVGASWTIGSGTGDAITATFTPAITALVDGQLCFVRAPGANATTTPTFAPNGLTAHTITKWGGGALAPGDIPGNLAEIVLRYNSANTRWELLNPATVVRWAVAAGSADAITATFVPPIPALVDGQLCFVRASAANATTTPTFAPDGLTAHTITKVGGAPLAAGNIPAALAEIILRYNLANTRWELLNPSLASVASIAAAFKNLSIKVASNTTVAIAADAVIVTDGANYLNVAPNATCNLGTTGANALDTGTIAIDTFYAIWTIAKPDGTTATLASASFTAPTMPNGYTFKARIGAVRTIHASATLYGTWQFGRDAQFVVGLAQTANLPIPISGISGNVSTPTYTSQSLSSFIPSTASRVRGVVGSNTTGATVLGAPNGSYGGVGSTTNPPPARAFAGNAPAVPPSIPFDFLLESTNIFYASDGGTSFLAIMGWQDNI